MSVDREGSRVAVTHLSRIAVVEPEHLPRPARFRRPYEEATYRRKKYDAGMLTEVANGVLLRRSDFWRSNAIVVPGAAGVLVVDPGVSGADLDELADDIERLGLPVIAGLATHPHWDHVLWHPRLGDVPRYATATAVVAATGDLLRMRNEAAQFAPGAPLGTLGKIVRLPTDDGLIPLDRPIRVFEHQAHAPGHAAVLLADAGVLLVGDMLSDVEIPLLNTGVDEQCGTYLAALQLLEQLTKDGVEVVVPGHGTVATGNEIEARVAADRMYVEAIAAGIEPDDPRIGPDAWYGTDWLPQAHRRNIEYCRYGPSPRQQ